MSLHEPVRAWTRQLVVSGATALHLDSFARNRERAGTRLGHGNVIRVLFLHGTPAADAAAFGRLLAWLQRRFRIIDYETFERLMRTPAPVLDQPAVLLTFDDGFRSQYEVAAPILEEAGLRALFFVVPGFSLLSGETARRFSVERIRGRLAELPMTPEQIAELAGRGHTIGNHTFSHAWLSKTPSTAYDREIIDSAAMLESWIGQAINTFAWPFVWNGISPVAYRVAAARHRYCFAPCSGRVLPGLDSPGLIWRANVEAGSRHAEVGFQCSALADRASANRRGRLRHLLQPSVTPSQETA